MDATMAIVGWFNVLFFTLVLANSVLRFFNTRLIIKHYKNTDSFAVRYRKIMFFFIQNHRWFGIATGMSVLLHFILALQGDFIPPTGIVLGLLVLAQVSLGVYGFYFKQRTGRWQRVHRVNGYVIMVIAIVHVLLAIRVNG